MDSPRKKPWPVFGVTCLLVSLFPLVLPFVASQNLAVQIETKTAIQYSNPVIVVFLAAMAFIFRERAVWPIIGILFGAFYAGLELIPGG
jgi:hypothetical protein